MIYEAYTVLKACVSGMGLRSRSLWVVHAEFARPYIEFSFGFQELPVVVPIALPLLGERGEVLLEGFPHYSNNFM